MIIDGLLGLALVIGILSLPVWIAARFLGAGRDGFLPAAASIMAALLFSTVFAFGAAAAGLPLIGFFGTPLAFLAGFALVLRMSMFSAMLLTIFAYALLKVLLHLAGGMLLGATVLAALAR